jgi:3-oxoacyl-[acyl-carrier protein] reductase
MAAAAHPAKRNARVEDVVPAIRFLLSPESDYVSGANFPVTAGSAL